MLTFDHFQACETLVVLASLVLPGLRRARTELTPTLMTARRLSRTKCVTSIEQARNGTGRRGGAPEHLLVRMLSSAYATSLESIPLVWMRALAKQVPMPMPMVLLVVRIMAAMVRIITMMIMMMMMVVMMMVMMMIVMLMLSTATWWFSSTCASPEGRAQSCSLRITTFQRRCCSLAMTLSPADLTRSHRSRPRFVSEHKWRNPYLELPLCPTIFQPPILLTYLPIQRAVRLAPFRPTTSLIVVQALQAPLTYLPTAAPPVPGRFASRCSANSCARSSLRRCNAFGLVDEMMTRLVWARALVWVMMALVMLMVLVMLMLMLMLMLMVKLVIYLRLPELLQLITPS